MRKKKKKGKRNAAVKFTGKRTDDIDEKERRRQ